MKGTTVTAHRGFITLMTVAAALFLASCTGKQEGSSTMEKQPFGTTRDGQEVFVYSLKNANGMHMRVTNYGAIVVSLTAPDRNGSFADVVLGCDSLAGYYVGNAYFGAIVGRYGNRIKDGRFTLDGTTYSLAKNNGPNSLHGGVRGFDKVVWTVNEQESTPGRSLVLTYLSKDGEEGYPGNVTVKATYTLTDSNEFRIDYEATTDRPTVVNVTQHSYFNLAGAGTGDILGHEVYLNADRFTPVDSGLIPTGELRPVRGTPMDFTTSTAIGARINDPYEQLVLGRGYDHNWVLNRPDGGLTLAARVTEPSTGRVLEVYTTEPGIQFYTGNFLDGSNIGKGGKVYSYRNGFCLETQHFPDSPNKPEFPPTVLRPGQTFRSATVYRFSAK